MNKFLITLAAVFSFTVAGVANAEMTMSGSLIQFVAMGDKVDGGVSSKFNRMTFGANTTTDNGWTVGGSFSAEFSTYADPSKSAYLPTSNSMYIATDMGTLSVGQTADATTALIPRVGNMVPGGGHDAGYQYLFDGGTVASNGVAFAEAYYAMAASRVNFALPSMNGFSLAVTYTPSMQFNTTANINRVQAEFADGGAHGETIHVAAQYTGAVDDMTYTIGVGTIRGNSQLNSDTSLIALDVDDVRGNNDLSSVVGAIQITAGNLTVGGHWYNNGDSFGANSDAIKAKDDGYTVSATYAMGNVTLGAGYAHQELVRGTRAATDRGTAVGASVPATAGHVREDSVTMLGLGYNMGGGVNTFIQYNAMNHTDGDLTTDADVDPTVLLVGISLGF
jgi:hypothetical protein